MHNSLVLSMKSQTVYPTSVSSADPVGMLPPGMLPPGMLPPGSLVI